ncbi:HutD family protein [Boseaceae bacterium BT-24-1]|nr:HutD family protein [Boseaceae bacterium BT-24-1]
MKLLGANEHSHVPWKNGHGSTTVILAHPAGAALEALDYRIFFATVTKDEAFSRLPGIDRTLFIAAGGGFALSPADHAPVRVTPESEPFIFGGDSETPAALIDGPVVDFNVMTRRGRFRHLATRLVSPLDANISCDGDVVLLICHSGRAVLQKDAQKLDLGPMDGAILSGAGATVHVRAELLSRLFLVRIWKTVSSQDFES